MYKYKLSKGAILKDGHTMFIEDMVKDLNDNARKESAYSKLKAEVDSAEVRYIEKNSLKIVVTDEKYQTLDKKIQKHFIRVALLKREEG